MQDLNDMIVRVTPDLQQDLTDSIVDVFNMVEALHFHIDKHIVISKKIQEARVENARLQLQLQETKKQLQETNEKLVRALEQPL